MIGYGDVPLHPIESAQFSGRPIEHSGRTIGGEDRSGAGRGYQSEPPGACPPFDDVGLLKRSQRVESGEEIALIIFARDQGIILSRMREVHFAEVGHGVSR